MGKGWLLLLLLLPLRPPPLGCWLTLFNRSVLFADITARSRLHSRGANNGRGLKGEERIISSRGARNKSEPLKARGPGQRLISSDTFKCTYSRAARFAVSFLTLTLGPLFARGEIGARREARRACALLYSRRPTLLAAHCPSACVYIRAY